MSQLKNWVFFIALMIGFTPQTHAQIFSSNEIIIAPSVSVVVEGNRTTVKEGGRLVLKAKGGDNFSTLQWQRSTDNRSWQNIPKANGNIYETMPLTHIQYFRVLARPVSDGNDIKVETLSNVQMIGIESNVASSKK